MVADVIEERRSEPAGGDGVRQAAPFETPFVEVYEGPFGHGAPARGEQGPAETPFLSEYVVGDEVVGGPASAFRELLAELYDHEFDEALLELVDEAEARADLLGADEAGTDPARIERSLHQWLEPLRMEAEALLERMGEALEASDPVAMPAAELDELLDRFEPEAAAEAPVFEDFLKKLWKKAKSAAKGAVSLAKRGIAAVGKVLPIGFILKKLRALVRPLLVRVLKIALNKLPPALRPAATQLAKRFLGVGELGAAELDEGETVPSAESPASADVHALQLGFDAEAAVLVLTPTEPELEALVAEAGLQADRLDDASLADLDRAREEFTSGLMELGEGEDPTPLVEQFVPAILGALRLGIGMIGRPKVVGYLAKFLGRLIAPYVGPQLTPPLSQAIVDAGLRLMTLEAGGEAPPADPRVAAEAFAALVEDTVTRVTELDEQALDEEGVIEEVVFEGFQRGARSHFPPTVLRGRGDRRGTGVWIGMPRRGPRRYRKYSRVVEVTVSPEAAALIRTRSGRTLATFLRDRLGRTGAVRARLHLYEAIPGTSLGRIARAERTVPGLGAAAVSARTELHPLTREAAGALLGQPELGEDVSDEFLDELGPAAVGQRFYYLEVAGGRPAATVAAGRPGPGPVARPRLSTTTAAIDLLRSELRIAIYLGEAQSQDIAARLRRNEPLGAALSGLRSIYAEGLGSVLSPSGRRRLRIVGETEAPMREQSLTLVHSPGADGVVGLVLTRWTRRVLAAQLRNRRDAFLAAAAAPQDGVTLVVRFANPPGLSTIVQLARGRAGGGPRERGSLQRLLRSPASAAQLEVVAGYRGA